MTSRQIKAILLSSIVSLTGLVFMVLHGMGFWAEQSPAAASAPNVMSFSNTLCFFLSGMAFYYVVRVVDKEIAVAQLVLPIVFLSIAILISIHLASMVLETRYARVRESLSIERYGMLDQIILTHPSLESMVNFMLVCVVGMLAMTRVPDFKKKIFYTAQVILLVSGVALVDNFLNLTHWVGPAGRPMDVVSFLMFMFLGVGWGMACRSE